MWIGICHVDGLKFGWSWSGLAVGMMHLRVLVVILWCRRWLGSPLFGNVDWDMSRRWIGSDIMKVHFGCLSLTP